MDNDLLGERMKIYESQEAERHLMPQLPIMVRCDGRSFSSFCRGLQRPFDERMTSLMSNTAKYLLEETNASIVFNQSDEISLVIYSEDIKSQTFFNGRIQKLTSIIASMATVYFNKHLASFIPEKSDLMPVFDCRVWNVPSLVEATNCILWRELDATKNSISMAAQHYYSHKELHKKNSSDKQEMLFAKGINWNDYPTSFKRGVYHRRVKKFIKFTTEELEKLPTKHAARVNPDLTVERSVIERTELPPITRVVNRVEVFFNGAEPLLASIK